MPSHLHKKKFKSKEISMLFWRSFPAVFSLIYAFALTFLPLEIFQDRANYLTYAEFSALILYRLTSQGLLSLATNEPLWLLINIVLTHFFERETTLRIIIFVPAFILSLVLVRNNPNNVFWMIFILLMPQVIKNHIVHLRQGVAVSVFVAGCYARPQWLRLTLMSLSGFIHSSLFVIIAIGSITWMVRALRLSPAFRMLAFSMCFLLISVLFPLLAGWLGARQADLYANEVLDVSGVGFIFWLLVLCLYISGGMTFVRNNSFSMAILIFYIASYFTTPVAGRIFESGIILVVLIGIALTGWRRQVFLSALTSFTFLAYLLRLDQPWLGWVVI